jgi:hypothetical protein
MDHDSRARYVGYRNARIAGRRRQGREEADRQVRNRLAQFGPLRPVPGDDLVEGGHRL